MRKLAIAILLLTTLPALATEYYVATAAGGGSNANNGLTPATPWLTIQWADDHIAAGGGHTIHVAAGTYNSTSIVTDMNGTATARIHFISDTKWGALIRDTTVAPHVIWEAKGNYVDIEGFDVSGSGHNGIRQWGHHSKRIGNRVHDLPAEAGCSGTGAAGLNYTDTTLGDNEEIGNVTFNIGSGGPGSCNKYHGLYLVGPREHAYNNISYGNAGYGITSWHTATDLIISGNLVFDNGAFVGGGYVGGGILIGAGDAVPAVTNDNSIVSNNIMYNNGGFASREYGDTGPNNRWINNIAIGNGLAISLITGTQSGTIVADPLFVNYQVNGTGDYHLQPGSPGIDAGTSIGAPPIDLDNTVRPKGPAYDIGPYEYQLEAPSDNFRLIIESNSLAVDGKLRWRCEKNNNVVMPARTNLFPISAAQRPVRDFLRDQLSQCIADFTGPLTDINGGQDPTLLRLTGGGNFTNSTTSYVGIAGLNMTLNQNTVYNFTCDLMVATGATTTGAQFAVSAPGTTAWFRWQVEGYTSATALATYGGTTNNVVSTGALPLSSAGSAITPVRIYGGVSTNTTPGDLSINVKSEIAASPVTVYRGSYCVVS